MPLLERCARVTIHAGETDNVDSIWEAVYHLNTDRIGHGLKLLDNKELYERFVDKKIGIEMFPSSNDQIIGYEKGEYPLLNYMREELRVTIAFCDEKTREKLMHSYEDEMLVFLKYPQIEFTFT